MLSAKTTWKVLLIGGSSGVGKSSIARQLGRRFGTPWMQVDDLRLALQHCRVILPEKTEALYFFEETQQVWSLPPERLRDGLIALVQAVFLVEPDEHVLLAHMDARYHVHVSHNEAFLRAMAHVRWLHGLWLAEEARRLDLPVLEPHPWETLAQRIVAAVR